MKCIESVIPLHQYRDDIAILYSCAKFVHGADFGICKQEARTTGKATPYAPDEFIEQGKSLLLTPPKPLKKMVSHVVATGAGGYGQVFSCVDKELKVEVAVKKLRHDCHKRQVNNYSEIAFLASCDHPNIVKFHKAYHCPAGKKNIEECWVFMEFLHGGTVREAVKIQKLSLDHIGFILREVLKGVSYIHSRGWTHRDLKSSNVMMGIRGEIKIVDLGLCCDLTCKHALHKQVGSPYWMAPEIFRQSVHDNRCDIWSAGVIGLEMINRKAPYYPLPLQAAFIGATVGFAHLIPQGLPEKCEEVLRGALVMNPDDRLSADDLLAMEWFQPPDLGKGIDAVFKEIFLTNRLNVVAAATFG
eukprot:TRINITY_DN4344_c0_g1_i4.p1 TRINITY_DN4344_c0_g1~~TRINITY_DN4344_c0_g1_i4.p1  ORF type:complete len:358 (+),score=60.67 TRINITY_DN4344_c0_g1_i4:422-1495(+)